MTHPSGRPWLLGCWTDDTLTVGQAGLTKIAVIGDHAVTAGELAAAAVERRRSLTSIASPRRWWEART